MRHPSRSRAALWLAHPPDTGQNELLYGRQLQSNDDRRPLCCPTKHWMHVIAWQGRLTGIWLAGLQSLVIHAVVAQYSAFTSHHEMSDDGCRSNGL